MALIRVALAGNPNVGKSTVFNALTGLHQHTGNWPGKTVETKIGQFSYGTHTVELTDVPGTYSLTSHSPEEEVTTACLLDGNFDCIIVVCDGTTLSRNLILALQILSTTSRCVLCLNLMDEAKSRGIAVDTDSLAKQLGCPVVPCTARQKKGLPALCDAVVTQALTEKSPVPNIPTDIPATAQRIGESVTHREMGKHHRREQVLDSIFTGRYTAYPIMGLLVLFVCWLTLRGAGVLSTGLTLFFAWLLPLCSAGLTALSLPPVLVSFLVEGVLTTLTQVIAVMLPPMAVFFPLFTLLEDLGYLPRVAFCLDGFFKGCGACGKQGLTMLMSLGCHAAGVTGCRIIDSPRERRLAMLTCSFVPCNGRLPMVLFCTAGLATLSSTKSLLSSGGQAVFLCLVLLFCVLVTLGICRLLSGTILRGTPSAFTLELPPYRIPQVGQVLLRSILDRTILVLGRAIVAAAPAGALLWFLSRIVVADASLLSWCIRFLQPVGTFFGMDGVILVAFLLSFPAAELFLPLVLTGYGLTGVTENAASLVPVLGWDGVTLLCVLCFTLFRFPCATTLMTIRRESGSLGWTILSALYPTVVGLGLCALIRWGAVLLL